MGPTADVWTSRKLNDARRAEGEVRRESHGYVPRERVRLCTSMTTVVVELDEVAFWTEGASTTA